jgi:mono/diheme cytochrome c family protein
VAPLPVRARLAAAGLLLLFGGQSAAEPRTDYLLHCMGCHLADGSGTPPGIPALRDRVGYYLQIPGGRDYLLQVPGAANAPLTDVRLAAVLNWVVGEFAGVSAPPDWSPFDPAEVRAARSTTPTDIDAWRHALWREIEARFASAPAAY